MTPALQAIDQSYWFSRSEFPDTVADCDPRLIEKLDVFRAALGSPIYPSPVKGAWVRSSGAPTSRHYKTHADAGDVFPDGCPVVAYVGALLEFGGVGIYFDTHFRGKPHVMLHVDLRPNATTWFRHRGEYHYPNKSPQARARLLELLAEARAV